MNRKQKKEIAALQMENMKLALTAPLLQRNCELSFLLVKLKLGFEQMIKDIDEVLDSVKEDKA